MEHTVWQNTAQLRVKYWSNEYRNFSLRNRSTKSITRPSQVYLKIIACVSEEDVEDDADGEGGYDYKNMITRDERRWKKADLDGDGALTKDEFASFLHPEDVEHMRDTVVEVRLLLVILPCTILGYVVLDIAYSLLLYLQFCSTLN